MRTAKRGWSPRTRHRVRWWVRAFGLAVSVLLLVPRTGHWGLAWLVPGFSPLVALASLLGTRAISSITCLGLAVAVVVLVRRRWFCRWLCPTGLLADEAGRVGRRLGRRCPRLPPVGQWVAVLTLGGALLGYSMLLWLDPLALLSSAFGVWGVAAGAAWLSAVGLLTLLVCSTIWPGIWCRHVCPLGATQDLLVRLSPIGRRTEPLPDRTPEAPQTAPLDRPAPPDVNPGMSRRVALGTLAGLGWAAAARPLHGGAAPCLRPPGALDETRFVGLCVRCGNCVRACPTNIIRPDLLQRGVAGLLAPVVRFDGDYCREDCTRCGSVCPSGALQPLALADKPAARMGLAQVNLDLCILLDNRECWACRNHCHFDAVSYVWSDEEYTLTPVIDPDKCPGCGACEVACPTSPDKAIVIVPREDPCGAAAGGGIL